MSNKPKKFNRETLHLEDDTPETDFIRNNFPNMKDGMSDILRGPVSMIENNLMADIFSPPESAQPDNMCALDLKVLHKAASSILMDIEGLVKCFARHGKNSYLEGDTTIERKRKDSGETVESFQITALENLIQAAIVGHWVELTTALRHEGPEYAMHVVNASTGGPDIKSEDELKTVVNKAKILEEALEYFKSDLIKELQMPKIFPTPSELATAFMNHQEGDKDFMESVKESMDKNMSEIGDVDKEILLNKIDDSMKTILDKVKSTKGIL
tara:strand:- start:1590 stop:2399 length:810 start_codon:yes stop_codon:yes gene_type:complete